MLLNQHYQDNPPYGARGNECGTVTAFTFLKSVQNRGVNNNLTLEHINKGEFRGHPQANSLNGDTVNFKLGHRISDRE